MAFLRRTPAALVSRTLLVVTLAAALLAPQAISTPQNSSGSEFKAAAELYSQKHYALAVKAFAEITQKEPRNMAAFLYLANSYYALGQTNAARTYYDWIGKACPTCAEAASAQSMAERLGSSGHADATASATTGEPEGGKQPSSSAAPFDMNSMIRVVKPALTHPPCSEDFIRKIKDGLKQCNPKVVAYLAKRGCKICITPTLIDRNPALANSRPRGYEDGHTYKNTPAMYDGREVVVCQYAAIGESDDVGPTDDPVGALRHEFGHAIDHHLGRLSRQEAFRHMYRLELGKVTDPGVRDTLSYYIQAGTENGGPSETFAQACCIAFGGTTSSGRMRKDEVFKTVFPNVIDYVKKRLKQFDG